MTGAVLADLILSMQTLPMSGEPIDQYEHVMQTVEGAAAAGADDELLVACALHDIGRARAVAARYPGLPHEVAGGHFAKEILNDRIAWLVEAHVNAKRFLVFRDASHHLSATSAKTLVTQGGPMTAEEAERFTEHRWSADAVALRRWDDAAKVPRGKLFSMCDLVTVYERVRRKLRR